MALDHIPLSGGTNKKRRTCGFRRFFVFWLSLVWTDFGHTAQPRHCAKSPEPIMGLFAFWCVNVPFPPTPRPAGTTDRSRRIPGVGINGSFSISENRIEDRIRAECGWNRIIWSDDRGDDRGHIRFIYGSVGINGSLNTLISRVHIPSMPTLSATRHRSTILTRQNTKSHSGTGS